MVEGQTDLRTQRLWIDKEYYMLTDEDGRSLAQDTYEGALGYVVKLYHVTHSDTFAALKIPKLIGTTHRENAYINNLMVQEVEAVFLAWTRGRSLGILDPLSRNPLQGQLNLENSEYAEARAFHDGLVFVYYEAGQRPRFLVIKPDGSTFPETISDFPVNNHKKELLKQVEEKARLQLANERVRFWAQTVYVSKPEEKALAQNGLEGIEILNQHQAAASNPAGLTWQTCLPSVVYRWAFGTLQKSIGLGEKGRGKWEVAKHLALVRNVCNGILTLHSKELIHADLRPANVVYVADATEPDNYFVADYGSLALSPVGSIDADPTLSSNTTLDRTMQGERTSVFYSPERIEGKEREIADRAHILRPTDQDLFVVLGWQDDEAMALDHVHQAVETVRNTIYEQDEDTEYNGEIDSRLQKGDRVRIQDYIFELRDREHTYNHLQILPCWPSVSKIAHGRIILMEEEIKLPDQLPVDRIIEMQQWSAATDIYSLGVLILYSIYRNTSYNPEKAQKDTASTSQVTDIASDIANESAMEVEESPIHRDESSLPAENEKDVEDSFRQMLSYLSSPPYFRSIWPDLESLRLELEINWENDHEIYQQTNKRIADRDYPAQKYGQDLEKENTIFERTLEVTRRITQTAPGTRRIVAALDFDLSAFVLTMHFALACLHRRNYLRHEESWMDPNIPFCHSRLDTPRDNAVSHALNRLKTMERIIGDNRFDEFNLIKRVDVIIQEAIPEFNPDPDTTVLAQNYRLEEEMKESQERLQKINEALQQVEEKLKGFYQGSFSKLSRPRAIDEITEILSKLDRDISSDLSQKQQ